MAKAGRGQTRRDSKRRVLRPGESVRADRKYQYKYHIDGKPHFVYSWKLEPTDKLPKGKKPCLSLRELEKQVNTDLELLVNIVDGQMTVCELVDRYLKTKTGVRQSTKQGYVTVQRLLAKETFGKKTIRSVKTSDAKLFLIKLQQEDGKSYSSIHTIRGVLRPAFQMAVDDDILVKNPFGFQLAGVLVNDAVTREVIYKDQMRKFLKFVHDDVAYCKYYEVVYILFHTGMRISEFCGLTLKDIDLEKMTVNIDHQLQRTSDMRYIIETTKTDAGTRVLPITEDVAEMFQAIIEDRNASKVEKDIDGYSGFLFYDDNGMPLVAMHWQHRFNHMVGRYNDIYRVQMPNITLHVCRHTYCSNMANKILTYHTTNREGYREYKSCGLFCENCPQISQCTESKDHTKMIMRHVWEEDMEKAEEIRYGIGNKQIYQLRKETIERIFGTAKEQHGFRYTQYIGKARMEMKAGLTFACMNLKKLAKILELRGKIKSSISYIFKNESKYWLYNEKWCWE